MCDCCMNHDRLNPSSCLEGAPGIVRHVSPRSRDKQAGKLACSQPLETRIASLDPHGTCLLMLLFLNGSVAPLATTA